MRRRSPTERLLALRSLPSSPEARQLFMAALDDPSPQIVRYALKRLSETDMRADAGDLRERMLLVDLSLVQDFAGALKALGDGEAASVATAALQNPKPSRRMAAARAMKVLGAPPAKPALRRALKDPDAPVRHWALEALEAIGPDVDDWSACIKALHDPDAQVRATAVGAVACFGFRSREPLAQLACDPSPGVRRAVAQCVGLLRGPAAERLLLDKERSVREVAINAAGSRQIDLLTQALGADPIDELRAGAARKLAELDAGPSSTALVQALADSSALVRVASLASLEETIGRSRLINMLVEQLPEAEARLRRGIVYALARLDAVEAEGALVALCADPDPEVRIALVHWAVGLFGADSEVLESLEADEDPAVRNAVAMVRTRAGPGECR